MRKLIFTLIMLTAVAWPLPVMADSLANAPPSSQTPVTAVIADAPVSNTGGVTPISPREFGNRISNTVDDAHEQAKPLIYAIAKVMVLIAAVGLIVTALAGLKIVFRICAALCFVGLGVILYDHAEMFLGITAWFSQRVGGH